MAINEIKFQISSLGSGIKMPDRTENHCIFNTDRVQKITSGGERVLPEIAEFLNTATDEKQVCEALYVLDRMIDNKVRGVEKLYPVLARFNDTDSPDIQVYLAGIYRKIQIPDAFGPLMKMMLRQTFTPNYTYFDPTEEIGGAILEYLKNSGAKELYGKAKANSAA